jgi:outer membrane protein, heavy metal efflux system
VRERLARISISVCIFWLPPETGCVHYIAGPLNPPVIEDQYRIRSLNNPELAAFVHLQPNKGSTNWPPAVLDLDSLTLVAYFYQPDLDVARARAAAAEAAVITARQRVNPSVSGDAGYSKNPESVITYAATPTFTIETAGKRGYRTLQAEKLAEAARLSFVEAGWQVRNRVRAAVLVHLFAQRRLDLLRNESGVREDLGEIFEKRRAAASSCDSDILGVGLPDH